MISLEKTQLSLISILNTIFAEAFSRCAVSPEFGQVTVSQRPDLSHYQCNGALDAAKSAKRSPRSIAEQVVETVKNKDIFSKLSVDGPGFINITLSDFFLISQAQVISSADYTQLLPANLKKNTFIDFGGPNVAKPMHVGHLRSTNIGDCLQRLLRFLGLPVHSDIHLGDWGTPMGMLICEVQKRFPNLPYFDATFEGPYPAESPVTINDLEVIYPEAAARCKESDIEMQKAQQATVELQAGEKGYIALWKHFVNVSVAALQEDFSELGVTFDQWFGESRYHDRISKMIDRLRNDGSAVMHEGALIVPLDSNIPPLMLIKSDGGYLYGTTDLATVEERVKDFGAEQILYVVDKRQSLHFQQLLEGARKTGLAGPQIVLEHLAFGTMNGPDGRPFKTRAGGVMKLKDLIALAKTEALARIKELPEAEGYSDTESSDIAKKVAIAALKFGDLMHDRTSDYVFDLEKFTRFEGRTGPYVLYAAVRIKSILRKAGEQGLTVGPISTISGFERELLLELCRFPDALLDTYTYRMPHYLCDYGFNVAQILNRFYLQCHILSEKDKALQSSWLGILQICLFQLQITLYLLGIDIPERM